MNALQKLLIGGMIAVPYALIPIFWLLAPAERSQVLPGQPVETAAERKRAERDDAHLNKYQEAVDTYDARTSELENELAEIATEHQEATTKTEKEVLNEVTDEIRRRLWILKREKQEAEEALERIRGPRRVLKGHLSLVAGVTFSPDSKQIASCACDKTVRIWDVATGQAVRTLEGHKDFVWSVAYSPDGKLIASAGWDSSVRIWDAETGKLVREISDENGKFMAVAFAPDGKTFATARRGGDWQILDTATGKITRTLEAIPTMFPAIAFDREGKRLYATSTATEFQVWNLDPEESDQPLYFTRERDLSCLAVSPVESLMATTRTREIELREDATQQVRWKLKGHTDAVRALAFSRDGKRLASGSEDKTVRVWNVAERKQELLFTDHTDTVWSVAFSPDGHWLPSAGGDMTVRLRPLPKGDERAK